MSPSPLFPKGHPPWLPGRGKPASEKNAGQSGDSGFSEEQLADYHAGRIYNLSFGQTVACVIVLTVAAGVVILPFLYMLLISLKGPAEVGNGRLLPDELENFRTGRTAWISVTVPPEDLARTVNLNSLPVLLEASAPVTSDTQPGRLPEGLTVAARKIAVEKLPGDDDTRIMLDAPDPEGHLHGGQIVQVYLPAPDQAWKPTEGTVRIRTAFAVMGRLLENYKTLLNWKEFREGKVLDWIKHGYPRWYFNSLFVAISTVIIGVFLDSLAAFGFAKFNFPFKRLLFALLIATLMIPYPVTLVPTFFVFAKLGFYNTFAALIIPGIVSAFGIFLVRQYMETIPDDMLDAARVDGAGDFQVYWRVMLPAARPVLAALAVFRFIFQWNTYLYPLVLTNKDSMKTVQLGIATMEDMHNTVDYGLQMAGSALAVLPILAVYMFAQKHFIAGITMGSSKG